MKDKVIIIPVHNQLSYLKRCVDSVLKNTNNFKLIIVDDGSTDKETSKWIENSKFEVIKHDKSYGFSISCNDGIDYAMSHYDFNCLCLLNSDAEIITKDWFDKVESYYISDEKIGISGVVSDNALTQSIDNIPEYLKNIEKKPRVICNLVHGFCYFINRKLIMEIGKFDNDLFPHYGGEDDYSLKSIRAGFKNIIVGSVFVKHGGEVSYSTEFREKLVKKTIPDLVNRWGAEYINICLKQSNDVKVILNHQTNFSIYYSIPYDVEKNLGKYYNDFMKILPSDDDFACFVDGDTIFTTSNYGHIIDKIIRENRNVGVFTATTNRVYCNWQIAEGVDQNNNNLEYHRAFGNKIQNEYGTRCYDVTNENIPMSGFFILINKKTWRKIGGFLENGMLGIDTDMHHKIKENGEKLYLIKGIYLYHWYRWPDVKNIKHLL